MWGVADVQSSFGGIGLPKEAVNLALFVPLENGGWTGNR